MTLLIEDDGPVRTILLNRPEAMNALSLQLRWDLCDAIQAARSDDSVRVIIMSGVGSRAFCVGLDLKELAARGDASAILGAEIFEDDVVASVEQCDACVDRGEFEVPRSGEHHMPQTFTVGSRSLFVKLTAWVFRMRSKPHRFVVPCGRRPWA